MASYRVLRKYLNPNAICSQLLGRFSSDISATSSSGHQICEFLQEGGRDVGQAAVPERGDELVPGQHHIKDLEQQGAQAGQRGVTLLGDTGAYTGERRPVLYCVVTRSEIQQTKTIVHEADPQAFMVVGAAHEALGEGFQSFNKQ